MDFRFQHLLLGVLSLTVIGFWLMPAWTVDDAYISYRYGRNLIESGELTWNPGFDRVEGYTGIFLPLLSALILRLGLPVVEAIQLLGVLSAMAMVVLVGLTLRRMHLPMGAAGLGMLSLVCSPLLYVHGLSGMETMFFCAVLALVLYAFVSMLQAPGHPLWARLFAFGLTLLCLIRPEGLLVAGAAAIGLGVAHLHSQLGEGRQLLRYTIVFFVIPVFAYHYWRTAYYGHFIPNAANAKVFDGFLNINSAGGFASFVAYYWAIPFSVLLVARYLFYRRLAPFTNFSLENVSGNLPVLFMIAALCLAFLIFYMRAILYMNFSHRFFVPLAPGLAIWLAWLSAPVFRERPVHRLAAGALLGAAVLAHLGVVGWRSTREIRFVEEYRHVMEQEFKPAASLLNELKTWVHGEPMVINFVDAGAIPFYTELRSIDFGRLNDVYLSREKPGLEAQKDYFFGWKAEFVVMTSYVENGIEYTDEAESIVADPRFNMYRHHETFGNSLGFPYFQHVFVRRDLPLPDSLLVFPQRNTLRNPTILSQ